MHDEMLAGGEHVRVVAAEGDGEELVSAPEGRRRGTLLPLPRSLPPHPALDQEIGGTRPLGFGGDRRTLFALLARVAAATPVAGWFPHPVLGPLTTRQLGRWTWMHVHHHLRQFGA